MNLRQLQYFYTLAQVLHYTKAAKKLHISQPSLSYAINELETEFGVKLFSKEKKKVSLTVCGQQILPYVEKALQALEEARDLVKVIPDKSNKIVRLGYFHSIATSLIPAMVEGFYKETADKDIYFHFTEAPSQDIFAQIENGDLDLGFGFHRSDGVHSVEIMRQPLFLVIPASHHLAGRASVSFEDFAREPMVMLEKANTLRKQIEHIFSLHNMTPNTVFEAKECNAAFQYVQLNFGVAILPRPLIPESEKVSVVPISDRDGEFIRSILLIYPRRTVRSKAVQAVLDYIIKNFSMNKKA